MSEPAPQHIEGDETIPVVRPVESPVPGGTGFAAVLRNRAFLSIWAAQITSQTAQNTLWFSLIIMVGRLTGQTALSIGFTIILVQIPTVLFSSVSGVLVDRVSKRAILVGTNVIRVGGVLLYIVFEHHLAGLYLVTFLVAVVSQPFAPAEGSSLPLLVKGEQLITANSLFQMTFMASQAVGFAVAPVAIGFLGIRTTLIVLAGLFAFAAVVLIPLPAVTRKHEGAGGLSLGELARRIWGDLAEVARFIFKDPPLAVALFQIALAPTLLLVLAEVGPSFLTNNLHMQQTSTSLFFLLAPAGLGLGLGIAILGQWGHRLRKDRLVLVSLIALGVTVIGLASVPTLATIWHNLAGIGLALPQGVQLTTTIVIISLLMGVEVAFINAPVQTIIQQRATPEIRGRVLAMQQTLTAAMAIPPLVVVGGIAAIFGTAATLALMGVVIVGIGLGIVYYA
ncbi:MAG: MFS transporter [Chloroflexota bacterium]|nr:MFS transporter [Chloroflexota bacterium]